MTARARASTKIRVRYGDSKRTVSQRGKRFRGSHSYRRGRFKLRVDGLRRGRQPPGQDREAAHLVRLRAGRRELDLAGPPLLMGVVNATPDSFSDAGELPDLEARVAATPPRTWRRARRSSTSAASRRSGVRPPVTAAVEIERVVPVIERIVAEHDVLVSVDTYKPEVAEAAIAAGAGMVNDVSGLRDPALADVCARTGAALVVMHTRVEPKGTLLDPGAVRRRGRGRRRLPGRARRGGALARGGGVADRARPGPGLRQDAGADGRVLRRLDVVCALGHPGAAGGLAQGLPRRDHGPRGARAGRRDARGARRRGRRRGEHPARPRRRRGGRFPRRPRRCCAASASSLPDEGLTPTASRSASLLRARLPAAVTTRPGADRPIPKKRRPPCLPCSTLPPSRNLPLPISTCSPTSSVSTATAASARPT